MQNPNNVSKTEIYVFRGLSVKAVVRNLGNYSKQKCLVFTWSMVTISIKMLSIKSVSTSNITFLNSWNALFSSKFKEKCPYFQFNNCWLRNIKLVDADAKYLTLFTENLVQKTISLLLAFKTYRKWFRDSQNQRIFGKRKYT